MFMNTETVLFARYLSVHVFSFFKPNNPAMNDENYKFISEFNSYLQTTVGRTALQEPAHCVRLVRPTNLYT